MRLSKLAKVRVQLPRGIPLRHPGITLRVRVGESERAPDSDTTTSLTDAPPAPQPETTLGATLPFGLVVAFTALISALLTASLVATFRHQEPSSRARNAEEQRARFEALDELRRLALERRRLEGLVRSADAGDQHLDEEWGYLGNAAGRLVEHQELQLVQATALTERLTALSERTRALLADEETLPDSLRPELTRLNRQTDVYLQMLRREIAGIEAHRDTLVRQIEQAELDRRQKTLDGIRVRIIHDRLRAEDARNVASSLRRAGAEVELYLTPITETTRYEGRLFYRAGIEEPAARRIARLAEPIELIEIEAIGVATPFLSLWIVGRAAPGVEQETDDGRGPSLREPPSDRARATNGF